MPCGNGALDDAETCDDGNAITERCAYGESSCTVCDATCNEVAGAIAFCGGGTVDFADWLRGFGNLLIVDHGDDFLSVYGNNESLLAAVGAGFPEGQVRGRLVVDTSR